MAEVVGLQDALISQIDGCAGGAVARPGTAADAIDGVEPGVVAEPGSPAAAAAVLGWASDHGRSVVVRGGGTKLGWGAPARAIDVLLSTRALDAVEAHRHGDLTATVQAGAALADVNAALAAHRQWLPLDPPNAERATIGGIVASNDSGPRRQRHGAPRDLIIGMTLARADGVAAKSGGIVVKNVAGYDLARLLTGVVRLSRGHPHRHLQAGPGGRGVAHGAGDSLRGRAGRPGPGRAARPGVDPDRGGAGVAPGRDARPFRVHRAGGGRAGGAGGGPRAGGRRRGGRVGGRGRGRGVAPSRGAGSSGKRGPSSSSWSCRAT